jgi:adenylosuccinate synthase
LSEARRGERKIGTTSRGIGPAYEDKIARRGVRVGDLANMDALASAVQHNVAARNRIIPESTMDADHVLEELRQAWARMKPWVTDVSLFLSRARSAGRSIMFEGAQGTLLDIDHGTYPYVTSSNATIGGVCTGLGMPPQAIDGVVGVAKAYTTRVGEGALPTELFGEMGDRLRESGQEFGAVTGRPRRCGWYDAVATRYAARVNGLDALALTKLDVLDGIPELQVCTAYRCKGSTMTEMPGDHAQLAMCEPVYETIQGWTAPTAGVRTFDDLPQEAKAYIARLEEITGVPAAIISTGSAREDTIIRQDSIAAKWFARAR